MDRIEVAHNYIMRRAQERLSEDELRFACPRDSHGDGVDTHPGFHYNVENRVGRCVSCTFSGGAMRIARALGWKPEEDSAPLTLEVYAE